MIVRPKGLGRKREVKKKIGEGPLFSGPGYP
jgi:hypothetical protein